MYQALYRKWRPQTFDEVVGQGHITETLKNQVKTGRLSHAYIFIGTRGTGKTTCARILARAVNCEHPVDGNPCGHCAACRGIAEGTVMDVVELDAASNNGVDNVRALREEAVFSPTAVKKRVYIIDEVHMLSVAAFNALLKILEEPPEHLMFILATTELQKVPATILSRCQRHSFKRIDTAEIAAYLETIAARENMQLTHEAAELIARMAEGGLRDALSLLDQCSASANIDVDAVYSAMGLAGNRRIAQLLRHIIRHETQSALEDFSSLWMDGKDPATLLNELSGLLRDVLMLHVAPQGGRQLLSAGYDGETLRFFAQRMTTEELLCAMETVQSTQSNMRSTSSPRLAAELCLISLCDNTLGESVKELRARISRVEEQLKNGIVAVQAAPARSPAPAYDGDDLPDSQPEPDYDEPVPDNDSETDSACEAPAFVAPVEDSDTFDDERGPWAMDEAPSDAVQPPLPAPTRGEPPAPVRAAAPARATAPEPVAAVQSGGGVLNDAMWKQLCELVAPKLSGDLRSTLDRSDVIRAVQDGNTLRIEVVPGFIYSRFSRREVLDHFAAAASQLLGREMRAVIGEYRSEQPAKRSLDELRPFPEVKFINE